MEFLLYLTGSVTFLFCFFFFGSKTGDTPSFVYLQYGSVVLSFYFLALGVRFWSSGRAPSMTGGEKSAERRAKWREQKDARRARRRY